MPEGVVWGGGEEAGGVGAGFLEGRGVEPGAEVGEDGVAGGVEGVGVGWGGVADGGDEEWADDGHGDSIWMKERLWCMTMVFVL